jgi:hypothetical protein
MSTLDRDRSAVPVYQVDDTGTLVGSASNANYVQGNVASGVADAGAPVKIGGQVQDTPPTTPGIIANGARANALMNPNGMLYVAVGNYNGTSGGDGVNGLYGFSGRVGANLSAPIPVAVGDFAHNGVNGWDRVRKANTPLRVTSSAASGAPTSLKGGASDLRMFWGQNGAAITYLQVYNKATAPIIGTDNPAITYPIAANAFFTEKMPDMGLYFSTGIAFAFTTDSAGTTAAAAAAVTSFTIIAD